MQEANDRMELLGIKEEAINNFILGDLTKIHVIHAEKRIMKEDLTLEELEMVRQIEEIKDVLVYYVIKDTGHWPDGEEFDRYTFAIVDTYLDDYEFIKKECIKDCQTLPAFIINMQVPEYSNQEEFEFRVISGVMINAS